MAQEEKSGAGRKTVFAKRFSTDDGEYRIRLKMERDHVVLEGEGQLQLTPRYFLWFKLGDPNGDSISHRARRIMPLISNPALELKLSKYYFDRVQEISLFTYDTEEFHYVDKAVPSRH